jgi:hypothetical protein
VWRQTPSAATTVAICFFIWLVPDDGKAIVGVRFFCPSSRPRKGECASKFDASAKDPILYIGLDQAVMARRTGVVKKIDRE